MGVSAIIKKRIYELKRQKVFFTFTCVFYLLFVILVAVIFLVLNGLPQGPQQKVPKGLGEEVDISLSSYSQNLYIFYAGTPKMSPEFPVGFPQQTPGFPKFFGVETIDEMFLRYPPYNPAFCYSFNSNLTVWLPPSQQEVGSGYSFFNNGGLSSVYAPLLAINGKSEQFVVREYPSSNNVYYGNPGGQDVALSIFPFYGPIVFCLGITCGLLSISILASRDRRAKEYFYRSGLKPFDYWKGMFVVDVLIFLILGTASCVIIFASSISPFSYAWPAVVIFIVLNSISCVLFAHWLSFWFDREETATRWLFFVTIFAYMVLSVLVLMIPLALSLNNQYGPTTSPAAETEGINWISGFVFAVFFPPCTLLGVLIELSNYIVNLPSGEAIDIFGSFGQTSVIVYLIFSIIQIPLIAFFIICHESKCFKKKRKGKDVVEYVGENNSIVSVKNLSVMYQSCCCCCKKRKNAVNNLDVEFDNGVFALLGQNGAGKSSLFNVLSGDLSDHTGSAKIFGLDCYFDRYKIREHASFVEQFDVPLDLLTIDEFLITVARIRKLPNAEAKISEYVLDCGLKDARGRLLSELSGGMRRKVSLISALLLPDLKMLLLDEPSTGIDIGSKRALHRLILDVPKNGGSVWLCSHSMDEVSFLSSHIGVMQNGQMIQSGSVTELEDMYGKRILIRCSTLHPNEVLDFLNSRLKISVELQSAAALQVTVDSNLVKIEDVFEIMKEFKQRYPNLKIKFSVSDATLSSAFIKFIEEQNE